VTISRDERDSPIIARIAGRLKITNANSDPCARRKPSWIDPGTGHLKTKPAATFAIAFAMIGRTARTAIQPHPWPIAATSKERPIDTKNSPNRSPRNGLISAAIRALNGVSAKVTPPRNAPRVKDSPTSPVAQPAARR
jgi:hypothetical protein